MRCPSCGALLESGVEQCLECGVPASSSEFGSPESGPASSGWHRSEMGDTSLLETVGGEHRPQTSRLLEFPGVSKNSLPQWRKELSERVREVQEKRAREAALESAEKERRNKDEAADSPPQLELLPQADVAPLNPLVSAALRRIERAHQQTTQSVGHSTHAHPVAALACAAENEFRNEVPHGPEVAAMIAAVDLEELPNTVLEVEAPADKVHNLVVVPSRVAKTEDDLGAKPKPRRMIADDPNDPALNYLDSVPTSLRVEAVCHNQAPALSRLLGAIVDLFVVAFLCAPLAAVVELANGSWHNWRMAAIGVAVFSVVSFLYLTISTALTGRTLGTRLFSLRIVDARTGLIPTGKQSAGRALVYQATLLTLGLASLYALVDSDKRTAHDRLTRTAVIAV